MYECCLVGWLAGRVRPNHYQRLPPKVQPLFSPSIVHRTHTKAGARARACTRFRRRRDDLMMLVKRVVYCALIMSSPSVAGGVRLRTNIRMAGFLERCVTAVPGVCRASRLGESGGPKMTAHAAYDA